jgi:hypothetical protein
VVFKISDRVNIGGKAGIFFDMPVKNPVTGKLLTPLEEIFLGALANKRIANGEARKKIMKRKKVEGDECRAEERPTVEVNEDTEPGDSDGEQSREDQLGIRNIGGSQRDPGRFKVGTPLGGV